MLPKTNKAGPNSKTTEVNRNGAIYNGMRNSGSNFPDLSLSPKKSEDGKKNVTFFSGTMEVQTVCKTCKQIISKL